MSEAVFNVSPHANDEDEEHQVRLIFESIPEEFKCVSEADRWVLSLNLFWSLASVMSPAHNHEFQNNLNSHLKLIVEGCAKLRESVREVENLTSLGPDVFEKAWRRSVFGTDLVQTRDGYQVEVVHNPSSAGDQPVLLGTILEALQTVSMEILSVRLDEMPASRPRKKTLGQVCYYVVRTWAALSVLQGRSVSAAFPSGHNNGFRWSLELIEDLMDSKRFHTLNLGPRTEGTVKRNLRAAVTELKQALQNRPYCEPEDGWQNAGRDSLVGLELLARAAGVGARSEMNGPPEILDEYFEKYRRWARSHDGSLADFNPF